MSYLQKLVEEVHVLEKLFKHNYAMMIIDKQFNFAIDSLKRYQKLGFYCEELERKEANRLHSKYSFITSVARDLDAGTRLRCRKGKKV